MTEQFAVTTVNLKDYEVIKSGNRWAIIYNGLPVEGYQYHLRKKDAIAAIPELIERRAYRTRIMAEDESGHIWTEKESEEIAHYAEMLKENKERFTLSGRQTLQESGCHHHYGNIKTIRSHYAWGDPGEWGELVCANLRRERAARAEAFRLAGAFLDDGYYQLTVKGLHNPERIRPAHVYEHPTRKEAENSIEQTLRLITEKGSNEVYDFKIDYIPAAWPFVCKFYLPEKINQDAA